ncbi:hypothetical protein ABZ916_23915 [Streptomyces sp. NPDC046853]|uniref:hypothetical protein n=1 Tax=Streptomyces sp. NPDC046853 TaxID=3154920 RepID=UPI00340CF19A
MVIDGIFGDVRSLRMLPDRDQVDPLIDLVTAIPDRALARRVVLDVVQRRAVPRGISAAQIRQLADAAGLPAEVVTEGIEQQERGNGTALLRIRPPRDLDPVALGAARLTRTEYEGRLSKRPGRRLSQRGISGTVERVTERFNSVALDDARLLTLAQPAVYETLFLDALDDGRVDDSDVAGIFDHISNHVDDEALPHLLTGVVSAVLAAEGIALDPAERDDVVRLAVARGLPLGAGRVRPVVLHLVEMRRQQGEIPRFVAHYLDTPGHQEIAEDAVDEETRQAMIDYLVDLRLMMTFPRVVNREFDEYFALAYDHARRVRVASDDPVDIARGGTRGTAPAWDFTVRRMSERGTPLVRPLAIRAAGALFYAFVQGELMRLFDLGDALVLEWHRGRLDVSEGDLARRLNRYEHLREVRLDDEERGMIYRRLLGFGQAEVLSGSLVNERFGEHFDTLMYEVTRLVDLQDRAYSDSRQISRSGVTAALVSLQHNLSQFLTGSAFVKTNEMNKQLEEAQELITDPIVMARYGGIEHNFQSTVKQLGQEFLGVSIPADDLVDLSEQGNDIFQFLADFAPGSVREQPFQDFLDASLRVIIARAAIGGDDWPREQQDEEWEGQDPYERGRNRGRGRRSSPARYSGGQPERRDDELDDWDR